MLNVRILQTKVKYSFVSVILKHSLKCQSAVLRKLGRRVFLANEDFKYFRVDETTYLVFRPCLSQLGTGNRKINEFQSYSCCSSFHSLLLHNRSEREWTCLSLSHVPGILPELKLMDELQSIPRVVHQEGG